MKANIGYWFNSNVAKGNYEQKKLLEMKSHITT